jgi:hypothetical protein
VGKLIILNEYPKDTCHDEVGLYNMIIIDTHHVMLVHEVLYLVPYGILNLCHCGGFSNNTSYENCREVEIHNNSYFSQ